MVRYPDSTKKLFEYFRRLDGIYPVYLSPQFFRSLVCPGGCGACCRHIFTMDWFPATGRIPPSGIDTVERHIEYNGYKADALTVPPDYELAQCIFLSQSGKCKIHEEKPLSCRVEPIKFFLIHDAVNIVKRGFSRGYKFTQMDGTKGTACSFARYSTESWESDVDTLSYLLDVARLFRIRLRAIRKLLDLLHEQERQFCGGCIPERMML